MKLLPCVVAPNVNGAALVGIAEGADPNRLPAGAVTLLATVDVEP